MHKFRTFIKKSTVILIRFNNKPCPLPREALVLKSVAITANQKTRLHTCLCKIQHSIDVVVVFPCVPAIAIT